MVHLQAGDWITVADAAGMLGLTPRRVQDFIADGKLKATKMGGRLYLLLRPDVEAFAKVDRPRGRPPKKPAKKPKK
jgi:excisionase family DNA binding protein